MDKEGAEIGQACRHQLATPFQSRANPLVTAYSGAYVTVHNLVASHAVIARWRGMQNVLIIEQAMRGHKRGP